MTTQRAFWDEIDGCGHPAHDDRLMSDGRPAHAWHNEIQGLRADLARLKESESYETAQLMLKVAGVARWVVEQRPQDWSQRLYIEFSDRASLLDSTWAERLERAKIVNLDAVVGPTDGTAGGGQA